MDIKVKVFHAKNVSLKHRGKYYKMKLSTERLFLVALPLSK